MKGIIYYTDNRLSDPLYSIVQGILLSVGLPIASASLKPITFGNNAVVEGKRGYPTMVKQILSCLERSESKYVFFCEHDVLYSREHFDFIPPRDDVFYYNENVWRWQYGSSKAINYDRMIPLSCLCVNRLFALDHYRRRMDHILERGYDFGSDSNKKWVRVMGFEPGTKKRKRGGFSDDDFETWSSNVPVIDVRHDGTFSPPKCTLESFTHAPKTWNEIDIGDIPGWDLISLFSPQQ